MRTTHCPYCHHHVCLVRDTRPSQLHGFAIIVRRRQCENCEAQWKTIELPRKALDTMAEKIARRHERVMRKDLLAAVQRVFAETTP